jgi:hypothetical protein
MEAIADMFWDTSNDVQMLRSDYLNQITHASDSWLSQPDLQARVLLGRAIDPTEPVVLGFDGSQGRVKGKADATALIGCTLRDGHIFEVRVWEQPSGPAGAGWVAPVDEVDAEVRDAHKRLNVIGFFGDPSGWEEQMARWEAEYGARYKVKASAAAPISYNPRTRRTQIQQLLQAFESAVVNGTMTYDGSANLTRHFLHARRRANRNGYLLYKAYPDSPDKIDAAYAALMAWGARLDALALGLDKTTGTPRRLY